MGVQVVQHVPAEEDVRLVVVTSGINREVHAPGMLMATKYTGSVMMPPTTPNCKWAAETNPSRLTTSAGITVRSAPVSS